MVDGLYILAFYTPDFVLFCFEMLHTIRKGNTSNIVAWMQAAIHSQSLMLWSNGLDNPHVMIIISNYYITLVKVML